MSLQNKTFFITGGTGFIGKTLIKSLLSKGAKIYCYGRSKSKIENIFGKTVIPMTEFPMKDFENKIDYVIHAACPTDSNLLNNFSTIAIDKIYSLTKQSLDFANIQKARYLYLSSMEVYDGLDGYLTEDNVASFSPSISRNSYPIGKIHSELLVNSYHKEYQLNTAIVRLSNIFGPGCDKESNKFFNYVIKQSLKNEDIVLKTTGNKIHNSCFIDDAINQILLILNSDSNETFNITNEDYTLTINEICDKIIKYSNSSSTVKHELEEGIYPKDSKHIISGQKIKNLFTFKQIDFESALKLTIDYFKN
ncbi:MAG: NAD(P)-dependent oxidoreductase [Bacillales bacterium]|nr:NAD(P)-dependent oxidoreductase [Bacillales bacterium]